MITTLSFYDFDGTLIDTPMPDTGKQEWKNITGTEYPHDGWWGKWESLALAVKKGVDDEGKTIYVPADESDNDRIEMFDIQPFPSILNQLRSDATKSDTYTVMLTSRLLKLQPYLEKILDKHNIVFDELSLKQGGGEKDDRVRKYLTRFPDVTTINVYDDRDKEMAVFSKMKDELGDLYQINVYRATDGKFGLVESNNMINKIISEEISIYIKVL